MSGLNPKHPNLDLRDKRPLLPLGKWLGAVVLLLACVGAAFGFFSLGARPPVLTIGISQWVSNTEFERNLQGFKDALKEKGYIEGENVQYLTGISRADKEKQKEIVQSFVSKKVDLIYSLTTAGTLIAKNIVPDIPIVFSIVTYPVEARVIASLANSHNNLVGTRNYVTPSQQYFTFERIYTHTRRLGFIHRKGEPNSIIQLNEFRKLLAKRGIRVIDIAVTDLADLRSQLTLQISRLDSLYSACDTLVQSGGEDIVIEFSIQHKKPSFTCNKDGVLKGALVGNVADFYTIGKISGEKAALILKGAEPKWIPTESPRKPYIMINTKTANLLGLTIPRDILADAKEVIQN